MAETTSMALEGAMAGQSIQRDVHLQDPPTHDRARRRSTRMRSDSSKNSHPPAGKYLTLREERLRSSGPDPPAKRFADKQALQASDSRTKHHIDKSHRQVLSQTSSPMTKLLDCEDGTQIKSRPEQPLNKNHREGHGGDRPSRPAREKRHGKPCNRSSSRNRRRSWLEQKDRHNGHVSSPTGTDKKMELGPDSPSRQFKVKEPPSPRNTRQRRQAQEPDVKKHIDEQTKSRQPRGLVRSSSFQSSPEQLLQVYKDLERKKTELDLQTSGNSDVCFEKEETQYYDSNGYEELCISDIDNDSMAVLSDDELDFDDLSQDFNGNTTTVNTRQTSSTKLKKHCIKERHFQGSVHGADTLATVASTASVMTDKLSVAVHHYRDGNIEVDHEVADSCEADDVVAKPTKILSKEGTSKAMASCADNASSPLQDSDRVSRSIKSPTFPPAIDMVLLQKQIKYLQHEKPLLSHINIAPSSPSNQQIIIHPQRQDLLKDLLRDVMERREILRNNRGTTRRNKLSRHSMGRRLSF